MVLRRTLASMSAVTLPDGRRLVGEYDFERDWWVVRIEGSDRTGEGHWVHAGLRELFDVRRGVSPQWMIDAADRLPEHQTPLGTRVMCRCCGFLTLPDYGRYSICPVCNWEDDPTTIFEPGERAGPGPNHLSLAEGRRNFAHEGISKPRLRARVRVRAPLPEERS
jgi:hypothetical protein